MARPASVDFSRIADRYDETRGGDGRGRQLADQIARWLHPDGRCVEVGVGTGVVAAALRQQGFDVVGVDLSPAMLGRARDRLGPVVARADAHDLPLATASVDRVHLVWVLHLVGDPAAVVAECARVLRPGGRLVSVSGRPRPDPDELHDVARRIDAVKDRPDRPEAVEEWAAAAGLATVHSGETVSRFEISPAEMARRYEQRVFAFLWDLDDRTWAEQVQPVIDDLRAFPDPDRPRARVHRHDLKVCQRPD